MKALGEVLLSFLALFCIGDFTLFSSPPNFEHDFGENK